MGLLLRGVKRKLIKEMLGYYIAETGSTPKKFILDVQKYHRGQGDEDYGVFLAGEIYKVLESKGLKLLDVLKYPSITDTLDKEHEMWLEKEIKAKAEGKDYKADFTGVIDGFEDKSGLDYLNTIDFAIGVEPFKDGMGQKFKEAIEEDKRLYLNIDATKRNKGRVIEDEMLLRGYSPEESKESGVQTLFRVALLKEHYNPKELVVGILNDVDVYKNPKYAKVLEDMYRVMEYKGGYCFEPKVINRRGRQELLSYTIWEMKRGHKPEEKRSLEMQEVTKEGREIKKGKTRLIRSDFEGIYEWMNVGQEAETLGYVYTSTNTLRILRRLETVTEEPKVGYIKVTPRNFIQVAAANAVRTILKERVGMKPKVLSSPDTTIDGYTEWVSNAIILYIYGNTIITAEGKSNKLFPITQERVSKIMGNRVKEGEGIQNEYTLKMIENAIKHCGVEAQTLKMYVERVIMASYTVGQVGIRPDRGFNQIREQMPDLVDEEVYIEHIEALKEILYPGIDRFGFNSM